MQYYIQILSPDYLIHERYPPELVFRTPPYHQVHSMQNCSHTLPHSNDSGKEGPQIYSDRSLLLL